MTLDAYLTEQDALYAAQDYFDVLLPGWEDRERFGDTLLDERDFALDAPEADFVPNEDWDAYLAETWTDPAERHW